MTHKNRRQNHKRLVRVGKYAKRYKHINWRVIPKEPRWRQIVKAKIMVDNVWRFIYDI